ncbi:MAG: hypothetical protein AVO38_15595 [delta proteobacterium ML8_D]|jgi:hypothetical protein|nr:MAG: hypothetical protein AVO38_15595 [delta proteobacterium ML8_D]
MKITYFIALLAIIGIGIFFEYQIFFTEIGLNSRIEKGIQGAGVFIALFAACIALATADPKKKKIKAKISLKADKATKSEYSKNQMSDPLKDTYKDFPDPVVSYQIQFTIENLSGFDLKKPTLSFALPLCWQHPAKSSNGGVYDHQSFNSNLFNSPRDLMVFEFADTRILSNSNLPFWNNKDELTFWVRMIIQNNSSESFNINISINSDNAEGITEKMSIDPSKLLQS